MTTVKLCAIGDSIGVILPKEPLARLNLREGDVLHLVEALDGFCLKRHAPEFERPMEVARRVMRERRAVLRELAK